MINEVKFLFFFFFSSRRRHTRLQGDWSSDVCSSDLAVAIGQQRHHRIGRKTVGIAGVVQQAREARSEEHTSDSSHLVISYAVFCLKKKKKKNKKIIYKKKKKKHKQQKKQ